MAKLSVSVFVCALYLIVLTSYSLAMTEDQKNLIRQHFHETGMECIKDHPITADDISKFKAKELATGPNANCFLACMLRRIGVMDESGMMQKETAMELAKKVFNDEEELQRIKDYLHSCSHINNEPVSDGEKGCDRAALSFKCMKENAAQFGFVL